MPRVMCIEPVLAVLNILQRLGLLPSDKFKPEQIMKLMIHVLILSFIAYINVTNAVKAIKIDSGAELNRVTGIIIPLAHLVFKQLAILINKKQFFLLLDDLRSHAFNNHSMKLNAHIQIVYKISHILRKYYIFALGSFIFITSILPFAFKLRLTMPPPFEVGQYIFIYKIIHFLLIIYLSVNSISYDVTYMSLMALCIAQLNILQERLMNIFEESREVFGNKEVSQITTENEENTRFITVEQTILKQCIILHEKINIYVDNLNTVLSLPLLVQYICGCFVFLNFILLLTITGEKSIGNFLTTITYSLILFSQMAFYHWLGNEINFKSSNIMDACYLSAWYKLDISSQKSLLTLMERTKRPLTVQFYKLVFISLKSLGEIVRWAYSLFALIKARYN